jgi:hypothetical protein
LYALRKTKAIQDIVQPAKPQFASATPSACSTGGPTSQLCVITLGLDSSLRAAPGFDDVTGVGAPTSQFIVAIGKG